MLKEKMKQLIGKSINKYNTQYVKDVVSELKFKEQYQGRIIDCMVGEVDDNYIETPETDSSIVKLEHSKEGIVKIPSIKGKTILVDSEGNETDTPGEGCRLISVGEEEDNKIIIISKNKNLFDGELEIGYINDNGINVDHSQCGRTKYIKIPSNYNYNISFTNSNIVVDRVAFYDINKNFISISRKSSDIIPNNCRYIRVGFMPTTWDNSVIVVEHIMELQIELGNNKTSYIKPKQHKTEILLDEPLRSLPNGVCDEIVGNKLIRRIGKIVLDKNNWRLQTNKHFIKMVTDVKANSNNGNEYNVTSNIIPHNTRNILYTSNEIIYGISNAYLDATNDNNNGFLIRLPINNPSINDIYEKIDKNNIEVLYELKNPIIEELPNSITIQGFDDITMYVENSITPTVTYGYNALIPYKEELSNQKEEVETNTLDIEQNIIPYLMDMEFNLMLMEDE